MTQVRPRRLNLLGPFDRIIRGKVVFVFIKLINQYKVSLEFLMSVLVTRWERPVMGKPTQTSLTWREKKLDQIQEEYQSA